MIDKINGKTPEEIKKGLECCTTFGANCDDCPYDGECMLPFGDNPEHDALTYIQQLERERDAAVEELRRTHNCNICKHHEKSGGTCEGWSVCGYNIPNWEWRGVPEVKVDDR